MDAYAYCGALYCESCALTIRENLRNLDPSEDSNEYPQGPYPDGGGEADTPQHCDACVVFLGNPLANDGYDYIRSQIPVKRADASETELLWAEYYDVTFHGDEYPDGNAA